MQMLVGMIPVHTKNHYRRMFPRVKSSCHGLTHQCAFATAGWTNKCNKLASGYVDVDAFHDLGMRPHWVGKAHSPAGNGRRPLAILTGVWFAVVLIGRYRRPPVAQPEYVVGSFSGFHDARGVREDLRGVLTSEHDSDEDHEERLCCVFSRGDKLAAIPTYKVSGALQEATSERHLTRNPVP